MDLVEFTTFIVFVNAKKIAYANYIIHKKILVTFFLKRARDREKVKNLYVLDET